MGSDIRAHGTGGSGRISIHAPRMGSDAAERRRLAGGLLISIHAPRMGSDLVGQDAVGRLPNFNPRSPDGERQCGRTLPCFALDFNPRSPDGERPFDCRFSSWHQYFNPRSPDGERRRDTPKSGRLPYNFNPRSPDGERPANQPATRTCARFQSTLPGWGATLLAQFRQSNVEISIHAPRMGSDRNMSRRPRSRTGISIHAPRMGSDSVTVPPWPIVPIFQSTLPGWGATAKMDIFAHDMGKIIHFQH